MPFDKRTSAFRATTLGIIIGVTNCPASVGKVLVCPLVGIEHRAMLAFSGYGDNDDSAIEGHRPRLHNTNAFRAYKLVET